jgi:hypothetical protein
MSDFDLTGRIRLDTSDIDGIADRVGGSFRSMAGVVTGIIGGIGLTELFKDAISEARDAEKVGRLTENVIQSTGGAAKISSAQVNDLAQSLSNYAGIDDDVIQGGENLLLTFKHVRNEVGKGNDIFNQASKAAVDLSATFGTDLNSAAVLVGKALDDPAQGLTKLTRMGVTFTDQQKEQIKTLVASGRTLDAQKIILAELASQTGGAAGAAADPFLRLQTILGNLAEDVGRAVLPTFNQFVTVLGDRLPPLVAEMITGVQAMVSAFKEGDVTSDGFVGKMEVLGNVLRVIYDVGSTVVGFLHDHTEATTAAAIAVLGLVAAYEGIKTVENAAGAINNFTATLEKNIKAVRTGASETQKLANNIAALTSKTVEIGQSGAETAALKVMYFGDAVKGLTDKVVNVTVTEGGNAATAIRGVIAGIAGALGGGIVTSLAAIVASPFLVPALVIAAALGAAALAWRFREQIGEFFTKTVPDLVGKALDLGGVMLDKGREALEKLRDGAIVGFDAVKQWLAELPGNIAYGLGFVVGTLFVAGQDLLTGLWNGAKDVFTTVSTWVTGLPQAIADAIGDVATWLYDKGSALLTGMWNGIQDGWKAAAGFFTSLSGTVLGWLADAGSWLYDKGSALLAGLWRGIQLAWNDPVAFFIALPGVIVSFLANAGSWLLDKGRDIIHGLANGITEIWRDVTGFFGRAAAAISDAVGDTFTWLKDAGANIINGLVKGVTDAWHKAIDLAKGLGQDFIKGFNDAVGSHSPARLMVDAGHSLMDGLVMGIDNRRNALDRQIGNITSALLSISDVDVGVRGGVALAGVGAALTPAGLYGATGAAADTTVGDVYVNINGVSNADDVQRVLPELTDAIVAGVGRR